MPDEKLQNFDSVMFREHLITWYEANKRTLPWRESSNPYYIWISEIMLQQTKVDTVIDYFNRFIAAFPTVEDLASAEEQTVLKMWEGLGYYSRARNIHHAAKEVVARYAGELPDEPKLLGTLKGIGPYTQGAVSSIAFGLPEPAVDGNVMRVLSRVLHMTDNISEAKTRKRFEKIVRELISHENPSSFNQGLMELGAMVCSPRKPACLPCPVREICRGYEAGVAEALPVKSKAKKQKEIAYDVLVIRDNKGRVAIEQRPDKGLLANMWQFPMVERPRVQMNEVIENDYGLHIELAEKLGELQHIFSHIKWQLYVHEANVLQIAEADLAKRFDFVEIAALDAYPISVSHLKIKALLG